MRGPLAAVVLSKGPFGGMILVGLYSIVALGPGAQSRSADPPAHVAAAAPSYKNSFGLKAAYMHLFEQPRESHDPEAGEAPSSEDLGGFILSYERVLYRQWLSLALSKPCYFGPNRFDSPFEILLKFQNRFGRVEPFVGVGPTWNVRYFDKTREKIEGTNSALSFGLAFAGGFVVWLDNRWGLELEVSYNWIAIGPIVNHEIGTALGPTFAF